MGRRGGDNEGSEGTRKRKKKKVTEVVENEDEEWEEFEVEQKVAIKNRGLEGKGTKAGTQGKSSGSFFSQVIKRVSKLNHRGLWGTCKIDIHALQVLRGVPEVHALKILDDLEAKAERVKDPSQYIQKAAARAKRPAVVGESEDGTGSNKRPRKQEVATEAWVEDDEKLEVKAPLDKSSEGGQKGTGKTDGKGGKDGEKGGTDAKVGKGAFGGKGKKGRATREMVEFRIRKLTERGVDLDEASLDVLRKVNPDVGCATLLALDDRAELPNASHFVRTFVKREQERQLSDAANEKINRPPPLPNPALFRMRVGQFLSNETFEKGNKGKKGKGKGKDGDKGKGKDGDKGEGKGKDGEKGK